MTLETILVAGFSGGLTGGIASLWVPYVKWGIEKRRIKFDTRRSVIQSIYDLPDQDDNRIEFSRSSAYSKIRPHLSISLVKNIEWGHKNVIVVIGSSRKSGANPFWSNLLDEVAILERKWDII